MNTFKKNNSLLIGSKKEQQDFPHNPANLVLVYDTSKEPANNTISVPINNIAGNPSVIIDWGDNTSSTVTTNGFVSKTYSSPGVYVVQISGNMTRLNYGTGNSSTNNKQKLVSCLSFGEIGLTSINNGFRSCVNLIECPVALPAASNITDMSSLFIGCTFFNDPNIVNWNTSTVTSLASTFLNATSFNQPIGSWNTSNVIFMTTTFRNAISFNQNISSWNTSKVISMASMFNEATSFNQSIGSWDVSNVAIMENMFRRATNFSQNISAWDIRKVTSMVGMFLDTSSWTTANYDASLISWADLPDIDLKTQAITSFAMEGSNTRVTSNGHGMLAGSRVNISGTTNYDGDYNVISTASVNTFDIEKTFVANDGTGIMKHRRSRNVTANFGSNKYSAGIPETKRSLLINTYGWNISDGGLA
jgi:surface protein